MRGLSLVAAAGLAAGCGGVAQGRDRPGPTPVFAPAQAAPGFWDRWGDGEAEVDTYSLVTPRYGAPRVGSAILVFVTEDFTDGQRVKSDGGHGDEYPVLKLNDIRHFQTGVYDYRAMTSSFTRLDGGSPLGRPVKVSLTMSEWCGHVYEQVEPTPAGDALRWVGHSYFDGEGDHDASLPMPADGVLLDGLPVVARGLVGEWPGSEPVEVTVLESLTRMRYAHRPLGWVGGTLRRGGSARVVVPAGTFAASEVVLEREDGWSVTWQVEDAEPHRLIRWTTSDGEVAELVGSERIAYWTLHDPGDEAQLAPLGLPTAAPPALPAPPEAKDP